ncbi:hypothetical protein [Elioraea sp.]|uniref:hypothetical protein n=1 Tax=Elioraea sp. TaxID=2185103 RepID=UPI003F72A4AC
MPLPGFVAALKAQVEPRNADWFAYEANEPAARQVVAHALAETMARPSRPRTSR